MSEDTLANASRDICENRHGGNPRSVEAHAKIATTAQRRREWCLEQIRLAGPLGRTCHELTQIASQMYGKHVTDNQISGRLSQLKKAGLVVVSTMYPKRPTSTGAMADVLVVPEFARMRPRAVYYDGDRTTPPPVPPAASWHPKPGPVKEGQQMWLFGGD